MENMRKRSEVQANRSGDLKGSVQWGHHMPDHLKQGIHTHADPPRGLNIYSYSDQIENCINSINTHK